MKNFVSTYRRLLAGFITITLALTLGACGGYTTVSLGGSVSGLTYSGLVIANDGQTLAIPAGASSYTFPKQIDDHGAWNVTVVTQPPHLTCIMSGGSGTATGIAINSASVYCTLNSYSIAGTVNNLTGDGLVLTNGGDNLAVTATSTAFTFAGLVSDGSSYGVAVLTQPAGQTCTVTNGTAVMGAANVTNIVVTCTP